MTSAVCPARVAVESCFATEVPAHGGRHTLLSTEPPIACTLAVEGSQSAPRLQTQQQLNKGSGRTLIDERPRTHPTTQKNPHICIFQIHRITLMFTIHYLNSRANGSRIAPITFTYSLQSRELWPLSYSIADCFFKFSAYTLWSNLAPILNLFKLRFLVLGA